MAQYENCVPQLQADHATFNPYFGAVRKHRDMRPWVKIL